MSRTDRLGDVVLTLPLCALLATRLGAEVIVLGRSYSRPVLEASPHVHGVLEWDAVTDASAQAQRDFLVAAKADAILHVFPRQDIARAAVAARIQLRIGTNRRWYHWLTCTRLVNVSRRHSPLHEAQLNVQLAAPLLGPDVSSLAAMAPLTALVPRVTLPPWIEDLLDATRTIVVLHPGSGASAPEWPLENWTQLVDSLDPARIQLLITGSAEEQRRFAPWIETLPSHVTDITGALSLAELIALCARVDGFVAIGTGPLHVAAGAGTRALGLFPPTPPVHPGRWEPLGPRAEFIVGDAPCMRHRDGRGSSPCTCMDGVTVEAVRNRIVAWAAGA